MQITTSKGKTLDIVHIGALLRNGNRLMIELKDHRALSEIASDFEGVETITKTIDEKPNEKTIFEGFTHLVSIQRNVDMDTVRLTLDKE